MIITFDPAKRQATFTERGLDFKDAVIVFGGRTIQKVDSRFDYGEERLITIGFLYARMVIIIWTPRGEARHIISMRKANVREQKYYRKQFEKS